MISDCYGRSIYYHVGVYPTASVPNGYPQSYDQLDWVSQIVPSCTANPPGRYAYGYQNYTNGEGAETVPFLHSITVPSPTGNGTSTALIDYNGYYVSDTVDGNGNTTRYTPVSGMNQTKVEVDNPSGTAVYTYTVGFDNNMSQTTETNGSNVTNRTCHLLRSE